MFLTIGGRKSKVAERQSVLPVVLAGCSNAKRMQAEQATAGRPVPCFSATRGEALTHGNAQGERGDVQQEQVCHLLILLAVQDGSLRAQGRMGAEV